jgi:hypothetical protein
MTAYEDELRAQRDIIDELLANEAAFRRKAADYRRGSFPSSSFGSGSNGSMVDSPMLQSDPVDAQLSSDKNARMLSARRSTGELKGQLRIQIKWLAQLPPLPEPTAAPCQRLTCDVEVKNVGSDRLRASPLDGLRVCPACYMHERRNGSARRVA